MAGAALVAATAGWFALRSGSNGFKAWPVIGTLAITAAGYIIARVVARWVSPVVPALLIVVAATVGLVGFDRASSPLSYANANGIYFALAVAAALTLWIAAPGRLAGAAALAAAVVFFAATLMTNSVAAAILAAVLGLAALAAKLGRGRVVVLVAAAGLVGAVATTVVLGATYSGDTNSATEALSEGRLGLWHDALFLLRRDPLLGAGYNSFAELSPTALSDRDLGHAHNEFLEVAAETGVVGMGFVVLLFLWAFLRVYAQPVSPAAALAAASVAAIGIHGSIDYVLHFVAIPLTAAVLLGAAPASDRPQRRGSESQ